MNNNYHAVLLDTVSIQRFIFGSNKLKENAGASELVQQVFCDPLKKAIEETFTITNFPINAWKESIEKPVREIVEIGYIGGGNALIFVREDEKKAAELIKTWSRKLLQLAPGLVPTAAITPFDPNDPAQFQDRKKDLFKKLGQEKSSHVPKTILDRHGITAECGRSTLGMEAWNWTNKEQNEGQFISSVIAAKLKAFFDFKENFKNCFADVLNGYEFPDEFDRLGQKKHEDSHLAIIHIDGNGMGMRFQATASLKEMRSLSLEVARKTEDSFKELLGHLLSVLEMLKKDQFLILSVNQLPIRPIIIGGDDVTFVSDGRIGIYLAQKFLEFFSKKEAGGIPLSACAGVAITKTKFPFYRGYELSEQLCASAKIKRRSAGSCGSWIDFHIASGGFSGELKEIRQDHYKTSQGELCFRPYHVNCCDENSWNLFIKGCVELKKFPRSKIFELQQALYQGETAGKKILADLNARGRKLPVIPGHKYHEKLWEEKRTPYFDMTEMIDFYPFFLVEGGKDERT